MDIGSYQTIEKLENHLSSFYESLYNQQNKIEKKIQQYTKQQKSNSEHLSLYTNIVFNLLLMGGLFIHLY